MTTYSLWVKEENKEDLFLVDLKDTDVVDRLKKAIAAKLRDEYTGPIDGIELVFQISSSTPIHQGTVVRTVDSLKDNDEDHPLTFRLPHAGDNNYFSCVTVLL